MTAKDQAVLFQCQKWHLKQVARLRTRAEFLAQVAADPEYSPRHRLTASNTRKRIVGEISQHARFASALTAVVSQPISRKP